MVLILLEHLTLAIATLARPTLGLYFSAVTAPYLAFSFRWVNLARWSRHLGAGPLLPQLIARAEARLDYGATPGGH